MAKENSNKSFVLRIDSQTMESLEQWAADEFRSINGQLQWIISDALRREGRLRKPRPSAPPGVPADNPADDASGNSDSPSGSDDPKL